jgi:hypothetical protein
MVEIDATESDEHETQTMQDTTENLVQQAARTQTLEAARLDHSLLVTGPTGPMCTHTGNGPEDLSLH